MSGSGKVVARKLIEIKGEDAIRYHVISDLGFGNSDETFVMSERDVEEPKIGDTIEWLGEWVYFKDGTRKIKKIGYSWSAK